MREVQRNAEGRLVFTEAQLDYMATLNHGGASINNLQREFDITEKEYDDWLSHYGGSGGKKIEKKVDELKEIVNARNWEEQKADILGKPVLEIEPEICTSGHVYFISCRDLNVVKIGFGDKPWIRLGQLQTAFPFPLNLEKTIDGTFETEKGLHNKFHNYRKSGEWFEFSDEIKDYIKTI